MSVSVVTWFCISVFLFSKVLMGMFTQIYFQQAAGFFQFRLIAFIKWYSTERIIRVPFADGKQ